ncbi:hypothetical protein A3F06_02130 [candidate division TM6 bacterium RIFCSPHIGHO2_12_FULL_36_22]|nr:MAG: hypothetical protein A3F06_02130 [candidate division TM6 bacterium RIFCSPHIGHO2_12_FULL_36_22]
MFKKFLILFVLILSNQTISTKELVNIDITPQITNKIKPAVKKQIGVLNIQGAIDNSSYKYIPLIRSAVDNKEMAGVIVIINSGGGDCSMGESIRMELDRLCKHKPVYVVATNRCGSMGYIIASVANKIFASPSSTMGHIGVLQEVRKYIDKHPLGRNKNKIECDFIYVGEHTLALHSEANCLSEEERTFSQNQIDRIYNYYCTQVAQSRNISIKDQHLWANGFTHSGLQAKRLGLIDELGTFNDALIMMKKTIQDITNNECIFDIIDITLKKDNFGFAVPELKQKRILFAAYHYAKNFFKKSKSDPKPKVGIINIHDEINAESNKYLQQLQSILKSDDFSGLILTINSAGGDFGIGESIYLELKQIQQKMPIVVLIFNCTSISYLIASVGNKIIGTYGTGIGGIGIWHEIKKYYETPKDENKNEISIEYIFAGEHKVSEFPASPKITDEERQHLQNGLDELYDHYCFTIAESRGLSLDKKSEWANGWCFDGFQAKELNLIDEIGSLSDAEESMKQLLSTEEKPVSEIDLIEITNEE